jgi:hypothetical protein
MVQIRRQRDEIEQILANEFTHPRCGDQLAGNQSDPGDLLVANDGFASVEMFEFSFTCDNQQADTTAMLYRMTCRIY